MNGTIYLLCFERPYAHTKHYLGHTTDLPRRLEEHAKGRGARLMAVVAAAGIGYKVARTWQGDRYEERRLKNRGGASRICPICRPGLRTTKGGQ